MCCGLETKCTAAARPAGLGWVCCVVVNQSSLFWANRLKDKMVFLSLNSSKANLVESVVPANKDRFKGKNKKDQRQDRNQNQLKKENGKI